MLYVRVDANRIIGMGHLGRCVAICREAMRRGERVMVLTSSDEVVVRCGAEGIACSALDGIWNDLTIEIEQVLSIAGQGNEPKVLLVDTYSVTTGYVDALAETLPVAYLGSKLFDSKSLSLVVNYSAETNPSWYAEHMPNAKACLGVRYAPLREEFWRPLPDRTKCFGRVLITTGGADSEGVGLAVCRALLSRRVFEISSIDLVIGPLSDCIEDARFLSAEEPRVTLHECVFDMALLMDQVDGAITAAGTTLYELCARRVPSVSIAIVKEQRRDAQAFDALGVVPCAGMVFEESKETVSEKAADIMLGLLGKDANSVIDRMRILIPDNGTDEVVNELLSIRR